MLAVKIQAPQLKDILTKFPQRFEREIAKAATQTGRTLLQDIDRMFDEQPWTPLHPTYRDWKAEVGFSTQILIRSGMMRGVMRFVRRGWGGWVGIPASAFWPSGLEDGPVSRGVEYRQRKRRKGLGERQIAVVMDMHENRKGRPRRELFGPVAERMRAAVTSIYSSALRAALKIGIGQGGTFTGGWSEN